MKIIKEGAYPKENRVICKECNCEFQYYNSEIITDTTTPDEEAFLGGFGIYKHIKCPNCNNDCEISSNFIESESIFDIIRNLFRIKKENK